MPYIGCKLRTLGCVTGLVQYPMGHGMCMSIQEVSQV